MLVESSFRKEVLTLIPSKHVGVEYIEFMEWLSRVRDTTNYLEVGVNSGNLLSRVSADTAIAVDPSFVLNRNVAQGKKKVILIQKTSDRFFLEDRDLLVMYPPQLIFLDGMHLFEYLLRDFIASEAMSPKSGLIVMHDCLPMHVGIVHRIQQIAGELTIGTPYHGMWTGDVWKVVPILRKYRPDLRIVCLDAHPTGLVCVSGLDSRSTVLSENYLDIVAEFSRIQDNEEMLAEHLYSRHEIVQAGSIVDSMGHGLYFL